MRTRVGQQVLMGALLGFGAALATGAWLSRRAQPPAPVPAPRVTAPHVTAPRPAPAGPARRPVLERAPRQDGVLPVRESGGQGPGLLPLRAVEPVQR